MAVVTHSAGEYAKGLSAGGMSNGGEVAEMKTSGPSPTLRMAWSVAGGTSIADPGPTSRVSSPTVMAPRPWTTTYTCSLSGWEWTGCSLPGWPSTQVMERFFAPN